MPTQHIRISGPFVVSSPRSISMPYRADGNGIYQDRLMFPVIHQDNVKCGQTQSYIALAQDRYNAQWIANALNMLHAIDQAAVLQNMPEQQDVAEQAHEEKFMGDPDYQTVDPSGYYGFQEPNL